MHSQYLQDRPLWRNYTVHTLGQVPDELRVPQETVNEAVTGLGMGGRMSLGPRWAPDLLLPLQKTSPTGHGSRVS